MTENTGTTPTTAELRDFAGFSSTLTRQFRRLNELKNHVVQIEVLLFVTIAVTLLAHAHQGLRQDFPKWINDTFFLMPIVLVALLPVLAPVTNPISRKRAALKWGSAGAASGFAVGTAITGGLDLGITATLGGLIGGTIGVVAGVIAGPILDDEKSQILLTKPEAAEYLAQEMARYPKLTLRSIVWALNNQIRFYNLDGNEPVCHKSELDAYLAKGTFGYRDESGGEHWDL